MSNINSRDGLESHGVGTVARPGMFSSEWTIALDVVAAELGLHAIFSVALEVWSTYKYNALHAKEGFRPAEKYLWKTLIKC